MPVALQRRSANADASFPLRRVRITAVIERTGQRIAEHRQPLLRHRSLGLQTAGSTVRKSLGRTHQPLVVLLLAELLLVALLLVVLLLQQHLHQHTERQMHERSLQGSPKR